MNDLISRQDAIDAIEKLDIPEDMCVLEILSHIELTIGTLPSAQPWIPCSERLPPKSGFYICTVNKNMPNVRIMKFEYIEDDVRWLLTNGTEALPKFVLAWMPRPQPWRGE